MIEASNGPLYHLSAAHEAEKLVTEITQTTNPITQPREYATAILSAVKSNINKGKADLALAIADAAEESAAAPALMWIGQKYALEKESGAIKEIVDRSALSPAHAEGLVAAYIHEHEGIRVGSEEYKAIEQLIGSDIFTTKERQHLHDELGRMVDESPEEEVTLLEAPYEQNEQGSTRLALDHKIFDAFPRTITLNGEQLQIKDELHVTIMHPKSLPELADVSNERLASFLASFVEENPIELTAFLNDFRLAREENNQTIVVRCTLSNLLELFARFNQEFKVDLPLQAAHVTLYTQVKNKGIYINDEKTMEGLEQVHLPELEEALRNTHLQ